MSMFEQCYLVVTSNYSRSIDVVHYEIMEDKPEGSGTMIAEKSISEANTNSIQLHKFAHGYDSFESICCQPS